MNSHSPVLLSRSAALIIGLCLLAGLTGLGYLLADGAIKVKEYERTVAVKGLSEREVKADTIIWPIRFIVAANDLAVLYTDLDATSERIRAFLVERGLQPSEVSVGSPTIIDKTANDYGGQNDASFRYTAEQTVTLYSQDVAQVRELMGTLSELGKTGIAFNGNQYDTAPQYLYTGLNDIKPDMIEEATRKAREVAQKFAEDSQSALGKIKRASQGQFSINPRDQNNPHIKVVRVVSTVEYYLSD